jgi:glycosyltransferase involved in cell wall biosynthesis
MNRTHSSRLDKSGVPLAALDVRLVTMQSTGDTSYWKGLLRGLSQLDEDFSLALCSNVPRPDFIPEDPRLVWHHVHSIHSRLWSVAAFPLAAKRMGAAVCHTQYSLSPLAHGGVTTIHDLSFLIGPEWFKPKDRAILSRSVPASVAQAHAVLAVSHATKNDLERLLPHSKGKITVTPNALGENITPMTQEEALQRRLALGVVGPYVLSVSTRWPRKNMDLAVQSVDLLPPGIPHQLILTGKSGWGSQAMGSRSRALGYVSDPDLTALYQGASAYLCPSLYEGFGIPLLEAFACGCPVITSSGGALPEVAGGAAIVVESWDPMEWSSALASLLANEAMQESLREKGLARVSAFSWKTTASLTLSVYRQVASQAGSPRR